MITWTATANDLDLSNYQFSFDVADGDSHSVWGFYEDGKLIGTGTTQEAALADARARGWNPVDQPTIVKGE